MSPGEFEGESSDTSAQSHSTGCISQEKLGRCGAVHRMCRLDQTVVESGKAYWLGLISRLTLNRHLNCSVVQHDKPEALFRLGLCFELGLGTEQNHEEAIQCYQAATKLEDATCAYVGLGCCYSVGHGVPQNDKKANEMFQFAVEKQNKLENLLRCI